MCCDVSIQQRIESINAMRCVVVVACLGLAACGGSGPEDGDFADTAALTSAAQNPDQHEDPLLTNPPTDIITTATSKAQAATWRALLNSPNYSGRIVVRFAEDAALTFDPTVGDPQPFVSRTGKSVSRVNGIRRALPSVPVRRLFHEVSDDTLRAFRERKRAEGVTLHDWTQVYVFEAPDPVQAELVLMGLFADPHVVWAHPEPVLQLNRPPYHDNTVNGDGMVVGAKVLTPPNITPGQDYLLNKPGSLNVVTAWTDYGLTGAGQQVYDVEFNWNYTHKDLPLSVVDSPFYEGVPFDPKDPEILQPKFVQHGTAVVGIIGAKDNDAGLIGIAPAAKIWTAPSAGGTFGLLLQIFTEFNAKAVVSSKIGGRVILVEIGVPPAEGVKCWEQIKDGTWQNNGCLPTEVYPENFEVIEDLTNLGVVVVEGAGNGGKNLNTASLTASCGGSSGCKDLSKLDSGALMVGASMGADLAKAAWSNCGDRVNVFAWGNGVVTTGYGDYKAISVTDDADHAYTAVFDGTSAATAQIGGVVLLLQEYVDKLYIAGAYGPPLPWQYAYLNAAQIRSLFTVPGVGVAQSDSGCNIGKQPNVGAALQKLKDKVIIPTIGEKKGGVCGNGGKGTIGCPNDDALIAKALNINADTTSAGNGRADLIAWGREGQWFIDLSAGDTEGYGKWDLILTPPPLDAGRLFPVVQDYNADGKVDLALYNTDTGKWRIKYTTDALFVGQFGDWDVVIDYQALQPQQWKAGSWPAPGDYDGKTDVIYKRPDGTYATGKSIDIALVRPDGRWLVDFNLGIDEAFGDFETDLKFLTTAQLKEAPGWAYLPAAYFPSTSSTFRLAFKVPDGVTDGERLCKLGSDAIAVATVEQTSVYSYPPIFGSNANVVVPKLTYYGNADDFYVNSVGLRKEQSWPAVDLLEKKVVYPPLMEGFGGVECRAVAADFDGDDEDDRAALCPNGEWTIAYTSTKFVTKTTVPKVIKNGTPYQAVPGTVYPGGVSYQELKDIYSYYNFGCAKSSNCTMDNLTPPIGPYFAECLKLWANHRLSCLDY